ncbi:2-nitropropane dioxygenase [Alicyclobacillus acidoterrestris]|nr:2-nitropropane dioxygenase [Alicyclobacillus acidoterrestris]
MYIRRLIDILGIRYPIIQGGMGNVSSGELCAAVSEAGGLGQIGAGTLPLDEVERRIVVTKQLTRNPFGVNLPVNIHPDPQGVIELIQMHDVPVVSLSAGNPSPWIPRLHRIGKTVMVTVASEKHAVKAAAAGADILVAEGVEAAGKNSPLEITTMVLVPLVARAVRVPVVAAGGIADANGLVAALALGASGVQMGTRLIATKEALVNLRYKEALLHATESDTLVLGRSVGRITRVLATPRSKELYEKEQGGMSLSEFEQALSEDSHVQGALEGLFEVGHVNAGQVAGAIRDIPTMQELFDRMIKASFDIQRMISDGLADLNVAGGS